MLQRSLKAPRSMRRVLRNNLTLRFPAVPIMMKTKSVDEESSSSMTSCSDDDSDAPWNQAKQPPGLVASVCNELFNKKKKLISQAAAVEESKGVQSLSNTASDKSDSAQSHQASANCENTTCSVHDDRHACGGGDAHTAAAATTVVSPVVPAAPRYDSVLLQELLSLDLNIEFVTRYQAKPKSMYTFQCAQVFRRDEYPWHFKNVHGDILCNLNGWLEHRCPLAHQGCTYSYRRLHPGAKGSTIVYSDLVESFGVRPPDVSSSLLLQRESVEREYAEYLAKTRGKEATPEIVTSQHYQKQVQVNGNLSRQIPDRRAMSSSPGRDLRPDSLTSLPMELTRKILSYLDGYSLCNVSLTCTLLRSVCCSLLDDKGIVVQEWSRQRVKDSKERPHWSVTDQVWRFSSAFEPVTSWGFTEHAHISEHLKHCPFYVTEERTVPVAIIPRDETTTASPNTTSVQSTLHKMYPHIEFPLTQEFQHRLGSDDAKT